MVSSLKKPLREFPQKLPPEPVLAVSTRPAPPVRPHGLHRTSHTLGLAWVHGSFIGAVFKRQQVTGSWQSAKPVHTLDEFAAALDELIAATNFAGTEVFLVLEHESFMHQSESAPGFSESAARNFLRGRVERFEKERGPVLWVSQRAETVRNEATFILHLLPTAFYNELNGILLERRLDLTRVLPVVVPLQLSLDTLTETKDLPMLIAAEVGTATSVLVARTGGKILFARTILASWRDDPARVAVEINRSLFFAKQQFSVDVDFAWLLGAQAEAAQPIVAAKCGPSKEVVVENILPLDWLKNVAKLSPRYPVNLVLGYLRRKRQVGLLRRVLLATAWMTLTLVATDTLTDTISWRSEEARLASLRADDTAMRTEAARLTQRNAEVERHLGFIRDVSTNRLPPVPGKFLAYVASVLQAEVRLTDFEVHWEEAQNAWKFRLVGAIAADDETARTIVARERRQMTRGPLRVRFSDAARNSTIIAAAGVPATQPFTLEGGLFEN